jgi:two-component system phosphate regulon sensor histidine kinase PhoR
VLYNLLDNAIKYSADKPDITVSTFCGERYCQIAVADKGIGIEKKYLGKIFDKFFRVPAGNVHNVKGFGIGLNYIKNVVNIHKWKIEVNSHPGKGSTFTITIPFEKGSQ